MKKLGYFLFVAFLAISVYNCGEEDSPIATTTVQSTTTSTPPPTTASVTGTGSLPPGVNGQIQNTRVALYTDLNNWNLDITFKFTACDANGGYTMSDFNPGNYFMDAWKDIDNDGDWGSSGDYVWIYGSIAYPNYNLSERSFTLGSNTQNFEIFVVP